jgi:chromosome segregation ATPase
LQLEEDCKRLEGKLQIAVQEQKKLSEYQTELDDAKLKIAQMEISQESWKKKYEKTSSERKNFLAKISKLDLELSNLKRTSKLEDSDDVKLEIAQFQMENETLKNQYENVLRERNVCKEKISELETELLDTRKKASSIEGRLRRSSEIALNSKSELEKELSRYKDLVTQLSRLNNSKEERANESVLEQRTQLEQDLRGKDEKLSRLLKDFEKIKDERDQLVMKLRNQAKQFEQYVKSQNKVSAELNLSPRSTNESTDLQKMKENIAKEVREEMEQKVAKELKSIGEQHLEKRRELEEKYKIVMSEWQTKYNERNQEVETLQKTIIAEKMKINQVIGNQLEVYNRELQARKLQIEKLEVDLNKKKDEIEEDRNWMAQMMTGWAAELKESKAKEADKDGEIQKLKSNEKRLSSEIKTLRDKEKHMKNNVDLLKHKYQRAKQSVYKYKVKYI